MCHCYRRHVADYITRRDGGVASDWRNVMLCAGASEGIRAVLKLMTNPGGDNVMRPGVMIPIPQYPLYSASLAEYNMEQAEKINNEKFHDIKARSYTTGSGTESFQCP